MVQQVVGQRRGGATVGAAGDVAPVVVAAGVDLPGLAGTGRASGIHAGQWPLSQLDQIPLPVKRGGYVLNKLLERHPRQMVSSLPVLLNHSPSASEIT